MSKVYTLDVALYGQSIGTLTLLSGDQTLFAFNRDYIENPDRPPLSLSYQDAMGGLITGLRPTRVQVPPFFSNLLPEGPLRDYLADRAGINVKREFFLLWLLGQDLPGAVTVQTEDEFSVPWEPTEPSPPSSNGLLHFSLAGVQLKFSGVLAATGGLTIPAKGIGGNWIVKLPSAHFEGVPENEYSMMTLARAVGIEVPEIRLIPLDHVSGLPPDIEQMQGNAFAIQRFDRTDDGQKIHIEDFAQVFGVYPAEKYQRASYRTIAEVLWAEAGEPSIIEFVRRLVFNALIGNGDMHLKNWSLIYRNPRQATLSPSYDFVSTIPYIKNDKLALKLGRSKQMNQVSMAQFEYLATKARLPQHLVVQTVKETTDRVLSTWSQLKSEFPMASSTLQTLDKHLVTVATHLQN